MSTRARKRFHRLSSRFISDARKSLSCSRTVHARDSSTMAARLSDLFESLSKFADAWSSAATTWPQAPLPPYPHAHHGSLLAVSSGATTACPEPGGAAGPRPAEPLTISITTPPARGRVVRPSSGEPAATRASTAVSLIRHEITMPLSKSCLPCSKDSAVHRLLICFSVSFRVFMRYAVAA